MTPLDELKHITYTRGNLTWDHIRRMQRCPCTICQDEAKEMIKWINQQNQPVTKCNPLDAQTENI